MKKFIALCLILTVILACTAMAAPATPAESDAKRLAELTDKWEALTPRQRKRVCRMFEQRGEAEIAIAEEFARLGLLTEEEAERFTERIETWLHSLEESGNLPPVPGICPHNS